MSGISERSGRPDAGEVQQILDAVPFVRTLGIRVSMVDDRLTVCLPYAPHIVGNPKVPALHGGALASLLQIAATAELIRVTAARKPPRMFSQTIEYLAGAGMLDTVATATVVSRSRRYANVRVEERQGTSTRPAAVATVQFLLVE